MLADFGVRRVRPVVDDLLSWLGVQILNENEWEDGLRATLDQMTNEGLFVSVRANTRLTD